MSRDEVVPFTVPTTVISCNGWSSFFRVAAVANKLTIDESWLMTDRR